jgi:hypothetical protein
MKGVGLPWEVRKADRTEAPLRARDVFERLRERKKTVLRCRCVDLEEILSARGGNSSGARLQSYRGEGSSARCARARTVETRRRDSTGHQARTPDSHLRGERQGPGRHRKLGCTPCRPESAYTVGYEEGTPCLRSDSFSVRWFQGPALILRTQPNVRRYLAASLSA